MSGGLAGDFVCYISVDNEQSLFNILEKEEKNWFQRILGSISRKNIAGIERKERIIKLLAKKYTTPLDDPYADIEKFLRDNNIRTKSEYWPNR